MANAPSDRLMLTLLHGLLRKFLSFATNPVGRGLMPAGLAQINGLCCGLRKIRPMKDTCQSFKPDGAACRLEFPLSP
jgi:hypothetical protein